jgi:hypothetical protein
MACVSSRLLDEVDEHPTHRHWLRRHHRALAPRRQVLACVNNFVAGRDSGPVVGDDSVDRVPFYEPVVGHRDVLTSETPAKPSDLHSCQVLDETQEARPRRNPRLTGQGFGQTLDLPNDGGAQVVEKVNERLLLVSDRPGCSMIVAHPCEVSERSLCRRRKRSFTSDGRTRPASCPSRLSPSRS